MFLSEEEAVSSLLYIKYAVLSRQWKSWKLRKHTRCNMPKRNLTIFALALALLVPECAFAQVGHLAMVSRPKTPSLGKVPRLAKLPSLSGDPSFAKVPLPTKDPALLKIPRGRKIPFGPDSKGMSGPWTTLLVVPLTPSIEETISPVPGEYPFETLLQLRVIASHPGWDLDIACTDLRLEGGSIGDTIEADEIYFLAPTGAEFPLEDPVDVIEGGDACDRIIEIRLAVHTSELLEIGEYVGGDCRIVRIATRVRTRVCSNSSQNHGGDQCRVQHSRQQGLLPLRPPRSGSDGLHAWECEEQFPAFAFADRRGRTDRPVAPHEAVREQRRDRSRQHDPPGMEIRRRSTRRPASAPTPFSAVGESFNWTVNGTPWRVALPDRMQGETGGVSAPGRLRNAHLCRTSTHALERPQGFEASDLFGRIVAKD